MAITHRQHALIDSGLFDEEFYAAKYPSVRQLPVPLVVHYQETGASLGYDPHPLFATSFYAGRHPEAMAAGMDPLYHYLTVGAKQQWQPHPLFDVEYYLLCVPDAAASIPALIYYLRNWSRHRRSPHPLFDLAYYLEHYPDAAANGYDPLSHYLYIGAETGHNPHPLFDTAFYYRMNPDVRQAGRNALVHYIESGGFEGRDPHPWFDSSYYNECNPDVAKAGKNPLLHYVQAGGREGRSPHPLFRSAHWAATHANAEQGHGALIQFVEHLKTTGAHPLVALRLREGAARLRSGRPGVNLIGWPRLEIGFGEYVRQIARAFATATSDFGIRDVSLMQPGDPGDDSVNDSIIPDCRYGTNLFVLNADNMVFTCERLGFEAVCDRFNIALWAWELSEYPDVWRQEMSVVDEFWAGSAFNQQCLAMKAEVPVVHMPQPVTISGGAGLSRADFGIPGDRFVFLFQFDFTAFIQRKNPYAAIAAFRKAFPHRNSAAALVIKTNNSERYPEAMRELLDAVGDDPGICLVNGTFRREKVMSLMQSCDAFLSLHRSEGFGRSLAEAMLMSKPVIATNYSGNTEFMRPDNSCLVNYSLIPVPEGQYPHAAGQVWADADIEHAAWYMRRLTQNRPYCETISRNARQTIAEGYNLEITGARYLKRLRLLGLIEGEAGADRQTRQFPMLEMA